MTSVVSQGSEPGPILFAIMMNDFPSLSSNSKMIACRRLVLLRHVLPNASDNLQEGLKTIDVETDIDLSR